MLIDFISIGIAVICIYIALEILGTYRWHAIFHRRRIEQYLRGKYVCGHCYYEATEEEWKENALRKLGEVLSD